MLFRSPSLVKLMKYVVAVFATIVPCQGGNKSALTTTRHCLHGQQLRVFVNEEPFWKQMTFVIASLTEGCAHPWSSKTVARKELDVTLIGKWFGRVRTMGINARKTRSAVAHV